MIRIVLENLVVPVGWEEKASAAIEAVERAPAADRATAIKKHQEVWSNLKEALKQLSHDKCWYCESRNPRSDNAVDHYRPKNRVHEATDHEGYWWLAFDWHNYRYSCMFCN